MITVTLQDNQVTALLDRARAAAKSPRPILRAMGTTLKSITEGTFNSVGAEYRPAPWPAKRDGTPSNLQSQNPVLSKSFFLTVTDDAAIVSNPTRYAAIHQFGGVIKPREKKALHFVVNGMHFTVQSVTMPARPFFPVTPAGQFSPRAAERITAAGGRALQRLLDK
jgi:phage gpG-like protein